MINANISINTVSNNIIIHSVEPYLYLTPPGIRINYSFNINTQHRTVYIEVSNHYPFSLIIDNTKYLIDNNKSLLLLYNKLNTELTLNNI